MGYGIVRPVLWTARDGATISGRVWATRAGPPTGPGIVLTEGSVQADEQLYWYAAQALAKAGYVVLTWDAQGQGQSDTHGEAPDTMEGVPAQNDCPYPQAPCHDAWTLLNPQELGVVGHSYGAAGVSYVGQWDPRVKAIVAWDNLGTPTASGVTFNGQHVGELGCVNSAARTDASLHTPALGMSADYFLPPTPNTSEPDPAAKSTESFAYSKAGVDTGELIIRGGSHLDFSFLPFPATYTPGPPFGATLRGADMIDWYTTAWFDKYLKHDCTADQRLLTQRWRYDGAEAAVDPNHDGNMFSFYYPSRLDIHLAGGQHYVNENLRTDTHGLNFSDGYSGEYSYIHIDRSPDVGTTDFGACPAQVVLHRSGRRAARRRHHPARRSRRAARRSRPGFAG